MGSYEEYVIYWRKRAAQEEKHLKELKKKAYEVAQQCAQYLAKKYQVKKVYLIGSSIGMHRFHEHSDVDLVVEGLKSEKYFRALCELCSSLPKGLELDLIPWEDAHEAVRERALKEGEILYEESLSASQG